VNHWIRTESPADAVIDFDVSVRDPANPNHIDPRYDGGDGLHFTAEGYRRLAEAIDLELLRGAPRPDPAPGRQPINTAV
jgi:lysophospholipase L1-like esterase